MADESEPPVLRWAISFALATAAPADIPAAPRDVPSPIGLSCAEAHALGSVLALGDQRLADFECMRMAVGDVAAAHARIARGYAFEAVAPAALVHQVCEIVEQRDRLVPERIHVGPAKGFDACFERGELHHPPSMDPALRERIGNLLPEAIFVSAVAEDGLEPLRASLEARMQRQRPITEVRIPISDGRLLAELLKAAPDATGCVLDMAHAARGANQLLTSEGAAGRARFVDRDDRWYEIPETLSDSADEDLDPAGAAKPSTIFVAACAVVPGGSSKSMTTLLMPGTRYAGK